MQQQEHTWLYYKLYVGKYYKQLDYLAMQATTDITKHEGVLNWFYIRYIDDGGIHLRFRIKVQAELEKTLDVSFYKILHDFCSSLLEQPEPDYTPLVSLPESDNWDDSFHALVVVKREQYEPEYDIYGKNIEVAEELFGHSSEIAREVLLLEQENPELSRKDIAPRLMFDAMQIFRPSDGDNAFLESFSNYWLAGSTELGNYKSTFEDKAFDLIDAGIAIVKPLDAYASPFQPLLTRWQQALKTCNDKYNKDKNFNAALNDRVLFYFVHLMNNRLGFTPLDEAYIAVILKEALFREKELDHEIA